MEAKSTDVRVLGIVLVAALVGSCTRQADNNPSVEVCTRYAEADVANDAANKQAGSTYGAAMDKATAAVDAAFFDAAVDAGVDAAANQTGPAYKAAVQEAAAAYKAAMQQAGAAHKAAYDAIYEDDVGSRGDFPAVKRHRQLCRELHGL